MSLQPELLYEQTFNDIPVKYVSTSKKVKLDSKGKVKVKPPDVHYLTANVFYDGTHWAIKDKIVKYAKEYLYWKIKDLPKIQKCAITIIYRSPKDNFDLDNKCYFWIKIFLDLIKPPTKRMDDRVRSMTLDKIPDDSVRHVNGIKMIYEKGDLSMTIRIYGTRQEEQKTLFG